MHTVIQYRQDLVDIQRARGRARLPYRKTIEFSGDTIDEAHAGWLNAAQQPGTIKIKHDIGGSLRREDAAKLYELAYFANGDILELGTNRGLSAFVMSTALARAAPKKKIQTVDLSATLCAQATDQLNKHGASNVIVHVADAVEWLDHEIQRGASYSFAFVDHSHQYDAVYQASRRLRSVLRDGSFVAFHDFNDYRNFEDHKSYGVFRAANEGLGDVFDFYGGFGCTGVFRLKSES
jgi:predicted O-methyltransferase YrrM